MIVVRALGPVDVQVDGGAAPAELLWRKNLALLIYLARSPRRSRTREHLVGLLWADRPEAKAGHSLREAVRVLRRVLGDEALIATRTQVQVMEGRVRLDTDELAEASDREAWAAAAALVGGEFLEGFSVPDAAAFEDWLTAERLQWRRRSVEALARHAEDLLADGRTVEARAAGERAVSLDPLSDLGTRVVIRSAALGGDRAAALATFEAYRARLRKETGAEPAPELRALAERTRRSRPAPPVAEPTARRFPLAGRVEAMRTLAAMWRDVAAGHSGVALIDGDLGFGKTRLLDEIADRARLDGAAVAVVRAVAADQSEPWAGALAFARSGLLDAPGLAGTRPEDLAAFATRIPEWADRYPRAARRSASAPGPALRAVAEAILEERPLLLLADDAHWLDEATLETLEAALRDLEHAPLGVVLTVAPTANSPIIDGMRAQLGRALRGVVVSLDALGPDDLAALATALLPDYDAEALDRVTRRVAVDSAGVPLLAVELLHAVTLGMEIRDAEAPAWPRPFRTLEETLPADLPDAIAAAVRIGVRRLSGDAQTVLAAASVLDERVTPEALGAVLDLDRGALDAALDELEWQRWLTVEPRGYAFVARIVREIVARDMLTAGQRRRLAERAAAHREPSES